MLFSGDVSQVDVGLVAELVIADAVFAEERRSSDACKRTSNRILFWSKFLSALRVSMLRGINNHNRSWGRQPIMFYHGSQVKGEKITGRIQIFKNFE